MTNWGVLFDWDGVILDATRLHERSWELLAAENRLPLPPGHFKRGYGMKNEVIIPEILGWTREPVEIRRLSLRKEELFRQLAAREGVRALPGVREWLNELDRHGVPRAIASSTHRENIETLLPLLGIGGFNAIITSEDVTHGKPDPEVFEKAARALRLPPERCVVLEDTHAGIAAARAAGCRVVAVDTTHPADTLQEADRIVRRLDELRVAELAVWFD